MRPDFIYDCTPKFAHFAYKFTGKERDNESGLDYFGARYYGSSMGRFMSPDDGSDQNPFNPQSWNLYSYGRNNPLIGTDPDGHIYYVCPAGVGNCTSQNGTSIDDKTFEAEQKQDQANGVSFAPAEGRLWKAL